MFAISRNRAPLTDLQVATHQLNRLFDEAFPAWSGLAGDTPLVGTWLPPVDIVEDENQVRIAAELPGVRPDEVKITLENNVLTIRGEKQAERDEKNGARSHRFERTYGAFERRFTLPSTVDAERIEARSEHGMLYLTLPKAERARPRQITVQVQA